MQEHLYRPKRQFKRRAWQVVVTTCLWILITLYVGQIAKADTTWADNLIKPEGWARSNTNISCQTQVSDPAGLQNLGAYRMTSTGEGDLAAASWITAGLQIETVDAAKRLTIHNLAFSDSPNQNWIQFRCKHSDGTFRISPSYRVPVDATQPANPANLGSIGHEPNQWSNNNVIEMAWSGANDATSGIFGYSYLWDTNPSTIPDDITDITGEAINSPPLSEGNSHYFHLRTRDNARNWTDDALHSGPYYVDTVPPENPSSVSSSTHTIGEWSANDIIHMDWTSGSDDLSGVAAYWFAWDNSPSTVPDTISTTMTFVASPSLPDGDNIWFHLRAQDQAANLSTETVHVGPYQIDTSSPLLPNNFQSSHSVGEWSNQTTITMTWSVAGGGNDVAGFSYTWDEQPDTVPAPTIVTTGTSATSPVLSHDTHNYFHIRAVDEAGNWSETVHQGPYHIDTQAPFSPFGWSTEPYSWTNTDNFTVTWSANPPDVSGIAGAYGKLDTPPNSNSDYDVYASGQNLDAITGITIGKDGVHDIYVWLQDQAGNANYETRYPLNNAFRLDRVPPETTHRLERPYDHGTWYRAPVTVYLDPQDELSRVSVVSYTIDGGPLTSLHEQGFTLDSEGSHEIGYFAMDRAGNMEDTKTITPPVQIDLAPPESRISAVSGQGGALGWFTSSVTVTLEGSDTGAGLDSLWYRYRLLEGEWGPWHQGESFQLAQEGRYQIQHYAIDKAGRQAEPQTAEEIINIDSSAPSTTHSTEGTEGLNGWHTASPVAVTLLPTDTLSSVQRTHYRIDNSAWQRWKGTPFNIHGEGTHLLEYYSIDQAGNEEAVQQTHIGIDTVAPQLSLPAVSPASTWHNDASTFEISWQNPPNETSGVTGVYYKFDQVPQGLDDYDGECIGTKIITHCVGLAQLEEGKHGLWVWLQDKAGNVDLATRRYVPDVIWYDVTPPRTELEIQGSKQGLWYNSDITIDFQASDPRPNGVRNVSGVRVTSYSVSCGPVWQTSDQIQITDEGTTRVCYRSQDRAGNNEGTQSIRLRIDRTPPPTLEQIGISPDTWTTDNLFTLSWENPYDFSSVINAYYAHTPPESPQDGTLLTDLDPEPDDYRAQVTVPGEGKWDLYLWLVDGAGNSNWETPFYLADAFLFDVSPPTANHEIVGAKGREEWWASPVEIVFDAEDDATEDPTVHYRLRLPPDQVWSEWQVYQPPLRVFHNGLIALRYYATDEAGNESLPAQSTFTVDFLTPRAQVLPLPKEVPAPTDNVAFDVSWQGQDPSPGSGIAGYGIQYRTGRGGDWIDWITGTSATNGTFEASPGSVYYFRARSRDVAGNIGPFSSIASFGDTRTYVQSVVNGRFSTPGFTGWQHGGPLWARQVPAEDHTGTTSNMALLGQPELGRGYDDQNNPITPVGRGYVTQTITLPSRQDVSELTLSFWYRVLSYDIVYDSANVLWDSFDVYVQGAGGEELLVRDGNYGEWNKQMPVADTGWKRFQYALTPYAGQTIQLTFACYNRNDQGYNTWAYVDDIAVSVDFRGMELQLPYILKNW